MRVCDVCGTKLPGKKGHGFVSDDGKRVLCGREYVKKTVKGMNGSWFLMDVETPGCCDGWV